MASCTARKNKDGNIISYQIKVFRGRDDITGKQLTPYTTTYIPPKGRSSKGVERDLQIAMADFEAACRRGEVMTKAEKAARAAAEAKKRREELEDAENKFSFSKYLETFLAEKALSFSPVTLHNYKAELGAAAEFFGETKLEDIDFLSVKGYFNELQTNRKNKYTGKPLKTQSVVQHYTVLHAFFESAVENEIIAENPMQRMKRPKPRKDEEPSRALSYNESELKYIIECLGQEPLMWRALVMFAIDSGCRAGEVMGLRWSEIDFETGRVNICRTVQYTAEEGVFIGTPKNRKNREIFLNSPILQVLAEWKRKQEELIAQEKLQTNGYCFTREDGIIMRPNYFSVYLRKFGRKYNLEGIHPHSLRHTMATVSIANGADIVSVSKKLGHANASITLNVYSHANEEAQRRANEAFAKAIY